MRLLLLFIVTPISLGFIIPSTPTTFSKYLSSTTSSIETLEVNNNDDDISEEFGNNNNNHNNDDVNNVQTTATALLSPAEYENTRFHCDSSVEFWKDFQSTGLKDAQDNVREIINVANRFVGKGGDALDYWLVSCIRFICICFVYFQNKFFWSKKKREMKSNVYGSTISILYRDIILDLDIS